MMSISDVLALLDRVPIWKQLKALPARVDALEKRLAELEGRPKGPALTPCLMCGGDLQVVATRPHPVFGVGGDKLLDVVCKACGHVDTRDLAARSHGSGAHG